MNFNIDKETFNGAHCYPHCYIDNFLNEEEALKCQNEILNIKNEEWDRYENPFEGKYTLRNKNNLPENCSNLFNKLISDETLETLSKIVGVKLYNDPTKNWWGIHKYKDGDHLDIHSDAGCHPLTGQKKHITLGIYLSKNWKEENGGHLEVWSGNSVINDDAEIYKCKNKILPIFNRMIMFSNTNNAWHGNPEPVKIKNDEVRIFLTLSYLSEEHEEPMDNKRQKAFFVKRPSDPIDKEKDKLRLLRCDPIRYKEIYNMKKD